MKFCKRSNELINVYRLFVKEVAIVLCMITGLVHSPAFGKEVTNEHINLVPVINIFYSYSPSKSNSWKSHSAIVDINKKMDVELSSERQMKLSFFQSDANEEIVVGGIYKNNSLVDKFKKIIGLKTVNEILLSEYHIFIDFDYMMPKASQEEDANKVGVKRGEMLDATNKSCMSIALLNGMHSVEYLECSLMESDRLVSIGRHKSALAMLEQTLGYYSGNGRDYLYNRAVLLSKIYDISGVMQISDNYKFFRMESERIFKKICNEDGLSSPKNCKK
ncbi:hypothetical protein [Ferrimonas sp. SCSIO 43195]|uniref:hypothetical protein n=1 Tax=Ferrimonas sp. SCSIO 43195 TaxID=2822844 RepID=UPI00207581D5|nr:hypothetical protein [Ferrimonas sp. SCSIO 43195]USD39125.1 hypothetical protein J8Z22_08505 [Ferrimonas sp. SCSIO 43195]